MKKKFLLCLGLCALAMASMAQVPPISHIDANNVRGTVLGNGTVFMNYQTPDDINPCPFWEVPVGSGKSTIFQKALWIGGVDMANQLFLAALRYGQTASVQGGGQDYWSGPLTVGSASIDLMTALKYHHIWIP